MEEPLQAHTVNEAHYYLMVTACRECSKGPWTIESPDEPQPDGTRTLRAKCKSCQALREFRFACEHEVPASGPEAEMINPGDEPSRIIDLGQWMSLFYLMVESAAKAPSRPETRRMGYRAALCLAEAMKFYGQQETPPATALFSEAGKRAFREHPDSYARGHLRDLQARLPPPIHRGEAQASPSRPRRPWWRFWGPKAPAGPPA